jgi:hypothetical protein
MVLLNISCELSLLTTTAAMTTAGTPVHKLDVRGSSEEEISSNSEDLLALEQACGDNVLDSNYIAKDNTTPTPTPTRRLVTRRQLNSQSCSKCHKQIHEEEDEEDNREEKDRADDDHEAAQVTTFHGWGANRAAC